MQQRNNSEQQTSSYLEDKKTYPKIENKFATQLSTLWSAENMPKITLIIICMLVATVMQANFPRFLSGANMEVMLVNFVAEGVMALGMTIVMITGGIDISVAGVLQFAAIIVGMLMNAGVSVPLAILLTLIASAIIGWINATVTSLFKVHPFITTLFTQLTLRGVNLVITQGATVSGFPEEFSYLGQGHLFKIPTPWSGDNFGVRISLVLLGVLAIAIGYTLKNHRYFQQAYFIGGNRRSSRMSGINVKKFLTFAYILSAMLAGLAGIIVCSQHAAASVSFGQNSETRTITAVAIGGTSFSGGTGTISGTVLGVLFLAMVRNAFNMTGVNTYWQDVITGLMLILAVFFGEYLKRKRIAR